MFGRSLPRKRIAFLFGKAYCGTCIFILSLEISVLTLISERNINKTVDFSRPLWFCVFFSPCVSWGQNECQPHFKSPDGEMCTDFHIAHACWGKASEILGCSFPLGGLHLSFWIRILFICIEKCLRTYVSTVFSMKIPSHQSLILFVG